MEARTHWVLPPRNNAFEPVIASRGCPGYLCCQASGAPLSLLRIASVLVFSTAFMTSPTAVSTSETESPKIPRLDLPNCALPAY